MLHYKSSGKYVTTSRCSNHICLPVKHGDHRDNRKSRREFVSVCKRPSSLWTGICEQGLGNPVGWKSRVIFAQYCTNVISMQNNWKNDAKPKENWMCELDERTTTIRSYSSPVPTLLNVTRVQKRLFSLVDCHKHTEKCLRINGKPQLDSQWRNALYLIHRTGGSVQRIHRATVQLKMADFVNRVK